MHRQGRYSLAAAAAIALGCGAPDEPAREPETRASIEVDTVAEGLVVPWDLDFAPDGRIFVTERPGRIRVVDSDGLRAEPWAELEVADEGEAGLLGLALGPDFERTGHVYVAATVRTGAGGYENRVLRLRDRDGRGVDPSVVIGGLPANHFHAGGAVDFGPDGMLYVTVGDALDPAAAQEPDRPNATILRLRPDGSVPDDNPDPESPVFARGVRNAQGLAWVFGSGDLFATDHGPSGMPRERFRRGRDELNVIVPGGNYGWPAATGPEHGDRFIAPVAVWTPAIAPAGLAVYAGATDAWHGNLLVGALRGQHLRRIALARAPQAPTGWRVREQAELTPGDPGRVRAVVAGPDGGIYFTTSNRDGRGDPAPGDDRILRLP